MVEHIGIAVAELDGRFVEVNGYLCDLLGFSRDELLRRSISSLTHPDDRQDAAQRIARLIDGDTTAYPVQRRFVGEGGRVVWTRATVTLLRDRQNAPQRILLVVENMLERGDVDEVGGKLAAIVESSEDAIVSKTLDGIITSWNAGAERIFGYAAHEVIGKPVTILFPPDHIDEEAEILAKLRRGERIQHYETVRMCKDGSLLNVSLSVSPVRDRDGNIIGASKIARDITGQKRAEAALRDESRVLQVLNQTGSSIASQVDLNALLQTVTDAATFLSGAQFGAFFYNTTNTDGEAYMLYALSGAPREMFERLGLPRVTPLFEPTFRGAGIVRSPDITRDPRYGRLGSGMPEGHLPVRSYLAVPVLSRRGETLGGLFFGHRDVGVFSERSERLVAGVAAQAAIAIDNARLLAEAQREIENRQRAEAALRETDRRKDEFLATLAHELRNPLAPIRHAAAISKDERATDTQKRWAHDVIARQVQHMALLLDDLLDVSRITRGTLGLRLEMTDLADVIGSAVETARPYIDAKRHVFSVHLPRTPVRFKADPLRLAQVVANLLTNSAKYTDYEGRIDLRARTFDDTIEISVSDNGIGIPNDALHEVFAMFSQVKSAQERADGGLGIGLALAKGLTELHGGTISVSSGGIGQGSEFVVRLPLRERSTETPETPASGGTPSTVKRRILVADDNRDAAEGLAMLLRMEGHDVTVVHDGQAALHAFAESEPEIAFIDIGMPKLNGYDVARRVRNDLGGRGVTLIAVTGWGQDSDKIKALAAGFDHHFTKPVSPEALGTLLEEA